MEQDLREFIKNTIRNINEGLPQDYTIKGEIFFDVSVITSSNKSGGMSIKVLSGNLDKEKQVVQRINFRVVNKVEEKISIETGFQIVQRFIKELTSVIPNSDMESEQVYNKSSYKVSKNHRKKKHNI